jgi:hypothetical protein
MSEPQPTTLVIQSSITQIFQAAVSFAGRLGGLIFCVAGPTQETTPQGEPILIASEDTPAQRTPISRADPLAIQLKPQ